jgi:hypothetical protein
MVNITTGRQRNTRGSSQKRNNHSCETMTTASSGGRNSTVETTIPIWRQRNRRPKTNVVVHAGEQVPGVHIQQSA